jgi:hypothetical protein
MATAALANGRFWQSDTTGIDTERVSALEAAVAALGDDDPNTRALLLIKLSVENLYELDPTHRVALAEEALATARAHGDPFTLANVLSVRHNVILSHATTEQRRTENEELTRLAEQLGDPNLRYYSRTYGFFWRLERGDIEGARATVREAGEISRRLAQPMFDWIVNWMQADLALIADLDEAATVLDRNLEIGSDAGIPDARFFDAVQRITLLAHRADPSTVGQVRALSELTPPHYRGILGTVALMEIAVAHEPDRARLLINELGTSPHAPWSKTGGQPDSALAWAAALAQTEAALGEPSQWTRTAYEYMEPWQGQFFGNIVFSGPTESYMAGIAPLAGYPDALDALLETGLRRCDEVNAPLNGMYARLSGACGLRTRNRLGDRDRAARLVDEAITIGDRLGAGIARAAAEHFPALRD